MALINCPECGKQISDKAPACIYCGCEFGGEKLISTVQSEKTKNKKKFDIRKILLGGRWLKMKQSKLENY